MKGKERRRKEKGKENGRVKEGDNHRAQGRHSENILCFVENPSLEFLVSPQLRNLSQPEPEDCSESSV